MITPKDWDVVGRQFWTPAAQRHIDRFIDEHGAQYSDVENLKQDVDWSDPEYIVDELNHYQGDNIWEDVIYGLSAFDGTATEKLHADTERNPAYTSDRFVAEGISYVWDEPTNHWFAWVWEDGWTRLEAGL